MVEGSERGCRCRCRAGWPWRGRQGRRRGRPWLFERADPDEALGRAIGAQGAGPGANAPDPGGPQPRRRFGPWSSRCRSLPPGQGRARPGRSRKAVMSCRPRRRDFRCGAARGVIDMEAPEAPGDLPGAAYTPVAVDVVAFETGPVLDVRSGSSRSRGARSGRPGPSGPAPTTCRGVVSRKVAHTLPGVRPLTPACGRTRL